MLSVLRAFGFDDFQAYLSTRDPEKSIGSDEIWERATDVAARRRSSARAWTYKIKEGDAAFYGPKIDIDVRDAIGRMWQLSTIQLDFNHPERFELEYVGADNARHRPIMMHRALFGSIERFFGVLVEHFAGAFPTWLAPCRCACCRCPTATRPTPSASPTGSQAGGYRVDVVEASDQLGKRIRAAKLEKIPYVLVVGDDDVAQRHGRRQPPRRRGRARRAGRRLRRAAGRRRGRRAV